MNSECEICGEQDCSCIYATVISPTNKIQIIPDDPNDQDVADQLSALLSYSYKEDKINDKDKINV